jgi:lysophospholipase L1-like esterase
MNIFQKIKELNLPKDKFVIVGGGTLVALGLLEWDEDIDICVTPDIFDAYRSQGWRQEEWKGKVVLKHDIYDIGVGFAQWSLDDLRADALLINGMPFISLPKLLAWKQQMKRPKDLRHIALIREYLASTNTFDHSVVIGRKRSPFLQAGMAFSPGLRKVQTSIQPFAEAWQKVNAQTIKDRGRTWVVLGDSMSQGIGASAYDKGWVGQAAASLEAKGKAYRILNVSSSGARIADVINVQLPAVEALHLTPSLVTVLIGSNDLFAPKYRKHLLTNLEELLNRLPAGTVVGNIFDRPQTPSLMKPLLVSTAADRLLNDIARKRKLIVVPLSKAFQPPWHDKVSSDYFHPNDAGYRGIARAFVEAIG